MELFCRTMLADPLPYKISFLLSQTDTKTRLLYCTKSYHSSFINIPCFSPKQNTVFINVNYIPFVILAKRSFSPRLNNNPGKKNVQNKWKTILYLFNEPMYHKIDYFLRKKLYYKTVSQFLNFRKFVHFLITSASSSCASRGTKTDRRRLGH